MEASRSDFSDVSRENLIREEPAELEVRVVTHELSCCSVFAKLVRLCIFKFASLVGGSCLERYLLNRFHRRFTGHGCCSSEGSFDPIRAERSHEALLAAGAEETFVVTEDREARLRVIDFKASTLKEKIEGHGGTWERRGDRLVIEGPNEDSEEWDNFYNSTLKRIFSDERIENGKAVLVTADRIESTRFDQPEGGTRCIVLPEFAHPYITNKWQIAKWIGRGYDVCSYDPRGIAGSIGYLTEAGTKLDAEAVLRHLQERGGYGARELCVMGSCAKSFPAIHMFTKCREMQLVLLAAPPSLEQFVQKTNCIARRILRRNERFLRAPPGSRCVGLVEENFFNSRATLESLSHEAKGRVLLVKNEGDERVTSGEIDQLGEAFRVAGAEVEILTNDPEHSRSHGLRDPHFANAFINPHLDSRWEEFLNPDLAPTVLAR